MGVYLLMQEVLIIGKGYMAQWVQSKCMGLRILYCTTEVKWCPHSAECFRHHMVHNIFWIWYARINFIHSLCKIFNSFFPDNEIIPYFAYQLWLYHFRYLMHNHTCIWVWYMWYMWCINRWNKQICLLNLFFDLGMKTQINTNKLQENSYFFVSLAMIPKFYNCLVTQL